jgi:hypothetical protein
MRILFARSPGAFKASAAIVSPSEIRSQLIVLARHASAGMAFNVRVSIEANASMVRAGLGRLGAMLAAMAAAFIAFLALRGMSIS